MMDELNALNAPKKVVDGLTEVFEGLAQMFEGVSDQLELLGADAVPEGKRIFPVVDQKAPAVSEKKGSAAPHPRRKPIKKTRKVEEAVDKPEDPVNDSDSDAGADTQLEAENSVGEAEDTTEENFPADDADALPWSEDPFNANGNRGVAAGLGNIQFVKDGDRLSGRASADSDFDALEDDEDVLGGDAGEELPDYLK